MIVLSVLSKHCKRSKCDYLQQLSHGGTPSIALRDFILQSFSIIDFISPKTITKNVCVRNVLGKALLNPGYTANFRMG